ncbi:hypothetical protein GCM10027589_01560 [Actinocorallia lasiicapitis]
MADDNDDDDGNAGLGITAALAALLFVILRLLAVTHYEWESAFALSDSINFDDTLGVLIGTFLGEPTWTAVLVSFLLPLLVGDHLRQLRDGRWVIGPALGIIVLAGIFVMALTTFRLWPALMVLIIGSVARTVVWRTPRGEELLDRFAARSGLLVMIAVLFMAGVTDSMWVPKERITLTDGDLVGYVVADDGSFLVILVDETRKITMVDADRATARTELEE